MPPPRPATTLAAPVTRNSRSQSSSWFAASSRPAKFMTTQMKATTTRVSMLGDLGGHRRPLQVHEVGGEQGRPQAPFRGGGEQQALRSRRGTGNVEGAESEVVGGDGERDADRQDQGVAPALQSEEQGDPVGRARGPLPQHGGFEKCGNRPPVGIGSHQRQGRQADGSPDSRDESPRHRVGDEAHQVGEAETPDHQAARPRGDGGDDERGRRGDEQRLSFRLHRCPDRPHRDHQRRRKPRDGAAVAACEGDDEAGREVPEQDQAHPPGRNGKPGVRRI